MSVIVVRKGNDLEIVEASGQIPEGVRLVLYTADEIRAGRVAPDIWEAAQLDSAFRESDEDWGDSLDLFLIERE